MAHLTNHKQATIITAKKFKALRHPVPKSLIESAGLMKHKRKALEDHLKKVRREWVRLP